MAYNWRSVLRALNSLSSAVKLEESSEAAEVSALAALGEAGAVGAVVLADGGQQGGLVVGEVLVHAEAGDEADGCGEIGGGHLVIDVVFCRVDGACDVLGLHAAEVEEHDDETAVFQLVGLCGKVVVHQVRDGLLLGGGGAGDGGGLGQSYGLVYILVVEADDALRLLVLGDGEVGLLEVLDDGAGFFVAHDDVGEHGLCVHLEGFNRRLLRHGDLRHGRDGQPRRRNRHSRHQNCRYRSSHCRSSTIAFCR